MKAEKMSKNASAENFELTQAESDAALVREYQYLQERVDSAVTFGSHSDIDNVLALCADFSDRVDFEKGMRLNTTGALFHFMFVVGNHSDWSNFDAFDAKTLSSWCDFDTVVNVVASERNLPQKAIDWKRNKYIPAIKKLHPQDTEKLIEHIEGSIKSLEHDIESPQKSSIPNILDFFS
jgi:hypothetical protein